MAYATQAEWAAAQPTSVGKTGAEYKTALESWEMQSPSYVNPMDYQTYNEYAGAANIRSGKDPSYDLTNQANFYGMTLENYQNALSGDMTRSMGGNQAVYGSQLLSPLEQLAAQTARGQGISTMSPETLALAKANPNVFNAAAQKFSNYFKSTYPGSLEYESVLAGPAKYSAAGVTMPTTSPANSMYFLDPVTKQITKNPNYNPTALSTGGTAGGVTGGITGGTGIITGSTGTTGGTTGGTTAGTAGLFGAPTINGRTQGLLGEIDNLPLGSYAGSIAPIQKSYENYMAIPAGSQFNPAMTAAGESPYQLLAKQYTGLRNVYEGQLPYTSMGGYNPALYVDLAKENKRMADITAAQAIQQQLDVLNQGGGGDGGDGGGGGGGGTGAGAGTGNAMAKGGLVTSLDGPNPPGPDDGSAYLDLGEYVVKKSSVNKYGKGLLDMINEGKVSAKKMKSLLG